MGLTGPHDYPNETITGGLVKTKRLLKKFGAAAATSLLALGLVAGIASTASADLGGGSTTNGNSGEITLEDNTYFTASNSGEITP